MNTFKKTKMRLTLGFVQVWLDGITMSSSNISVLQFGA